ncbi:hypothetical protein GCM10022222_37710 [Amycolatopsis ultiminotia]|uniref:Uncharacterized protein n=1 Tax=Amycolatopsis ultiminotia TaxID=543629 RepID=A0ABP6WH67_9PSEU
MHDGDAQRQRTQQKDLPDAAEPVRRHAPTVLKRRAADAPSPSERYVTQYEPG